MFRAILFFLFISPGLVSAASFDCSKAASLPEMTICNDAELSRLDDELSLIYQRAKSKAPNQKAFKQQTQAAWKWRETNCKTKECLVTWYAQRKTTLLKIADTASIARCLTDGPIRVGGFITPQIIALQPDGRQSTVYVLNIKDPICVRVEPIETGEARDITVNRFQLVSYSDVDMPKKFRQYLFKEVTVSGVMSTNNVTQYYAESNAIDVKSIHAP